MNILLTNDDGYQSPLFLYFAEFLREEKWVSSLTLVAPAHEQSWVGSAITTHSAVSHAIVELNQLKIHTISGTPSDCATIGAYHLCSQIPDLVISGINFGTNTGTAFCTNSGTLAAARQAALLGIMGVACSALLETELRLGWKRKDFAYMRERSRELREISQYHVGLLRTCYDQGYLQKDNRYDYFSINSPIDLTEKKLLHSSVKDMRYKNFFTKIDEHTFRHTFTGFMDDSSVPKRSTSSLPRDYDALLSGNPTITFFNIAVGDIDIRAID